MSKFQDLTGQRFGRLVVIERAKDYIRPNGQSQVQWRCKCDCGNEIETGSIEENITVEICNKCHPFYTGNQKIMDTEGRVERFKKRYEQK